jgi:8-oxo-dGTP pyrophosphatase MutT (NUDIX family)
MPATEISTKEAKQDKLFYFVANVVVYRESDGRCLVLKRHPREKAHPNVYTTPGGKLEWKDLPIDSPTRVNGEVLDYEDAVEDLLIRETREEAGIEISKDFQYINSVAFIRPDGIPVILAKFCARYESGDVVLEESSFTDYKWVNAEEVLELDCIKGVAEEIAKAIGIFTSRP